jgi:hypothetical protein
MYIFTVDAGACTCQDMDNRAEYAAIPADDSTVPDKSKEPGFFIDRDSGTFMTYKYREVKRDCCRGVMRVTAILIVAGAYVAAWSYCDICVLGVAVGSCAASCVGCGFLSFNCFAGILASLIKGFRIGSEVASLDIHWKM